MSDTETEQVSQEAEVQTETQAPSLDDVINEFQFPAEQQPAQYQNFDQQNYQQQSNPQQQNWSPQQQNFQPQQNYIDPFNADQVNQYFSQAMQGQTVLQTQLQSLSEKLSSYEQREQQRRVESDIKQAVDSISKKVDGADPMMVEIYLEKRARDSEGFRKIWENRANKPAALNKALDAIASEMRDRFHVKADPQLIENNRAMSQPTSSPTSNADPFQERWDAASPAERDLMWQQLKGG